MIIENWFSKVIKKHLVCNLKGTKLRQLENISQNKQIVYIMYPIFIINSFLGKA